MDLKFSKSTDTEEEIQLDSTLISATWNAGLAIAGQSASFEVLTAFVGDGAAIKIKGKSEKGKKLGKVSDVIVQNRYAGCLEIPGDMEPDDEIYFEVELAKNGLVGESNRIPVIPGVQVTNMKWSADEARRGDVLKLSADISGLKDRTEVDLVIYEYDRDRAHDKIVELPATVQDGKVEVEWVYEYHEDTHEIPTDEETKRYGGTYNPPEYFFTVKTESAEFGRDQESGLLTFKDWIEIELVDESGRPRPNEKYTLTLPDGTQPTGNLDGEGKAVEKDVPPGRIEIEFDLSES